MNTGLRRLIEIARRIDMTPQQRERQRRSFAYGSARIENERVTFEMDPYAAARDAHAIAVLTEWPYFADLDYEAIYESMVKPAFIFDGRNILDQRRLFEIGFNVYSIGKPPRVHFR